MLWAYACCVFRAGRIFLEHTLGSVPAEPCPASTVASINEICKEFRPAGALQNTSDATSDTSESDENGVEARRARSIRFSDS